MVKAKDETRQLSDGQWEVAKLPPLDRWVVGTNLEDPMRSNVIAELYANKADADLMATAKDMHDVLKELTDFMYWWADSKKLVPDEDYLKWKAKYMKALKVLAKAEGDVTTLETIKRLEGQS